MYPIIDRSSFRSTWPQLYEQDSTALDDDLLTTFYLVVAVGDGNNKTSAEMAFQAGQISHSLYHKSWAVLHDCLAVPNVSTVQILLLHVSEKSLLTRVYLLKLPRLSSTCSAARQDLLGSCVD